MAFSDELGKLDELRQRGILTDEEFSRAKARLLDAPIEGSHRDQGTGSASGSTAAAINGLRRSRSDRWIAGVCGGIARSTGVESWVWRLAFTLAFILFGAGLFLYLLAWIFVPVD
jgi:phage shock protein PspC (stress-responsive transcriptional regulator)